MDLAKALGILGFTSTRWLDMSSGLTPKQVLDKAHFTKMMEIMKSLALVTSEKGQHGSSTYLQCAIKIYQDLYFSQSVRTTVGT